MFVFAAVFVRHFHCDLLRDGSTGDGVAAVHGRGAGCNPHGRSADHDERGRQRVRADGRPPPSCHRVSPWRRRHHRPGEYVTVTGCHGKGCCKPCEATLERLGTC